MYFHDLIAHLTLVLNNILLSGYITVHVPRYLPKGILAASKFYNYEQSFYKHSYTGIFVGMSFQLLGKSARMTAGLYDKRFVFIGLVARKGREGKSGGQGVEGREEFSSLLSLCMIFKQRRVTIFE